MNETKRKLPATPLPVAPSPRRQEESAPSAVDWWLSYQEIPSICDESLDEVLLAFHPFARKKGGEP